MRLSEKIVWSVILSIALIFSIGASFMILQNHHHMLERTLQQNITTHRSTSFSLESKLVQDSVSSSTEYGSQAEAMKYRAMYYMAQLQAQVSQQQILYQLHDADGALLYTDANATLSLQDVTIDTLRYQLTLIDHTHVQLLSSVIQAGNTTFTLTSWYDLSAIYQERTRQFQAFLLIDCCMLVISYLIIHLLSSYLTKPILRLNDISKEIASGNYHMRTNMQGEDEIGQLSKSFDEMAQTNEMTIQVLKQNVEDMEAFMGSFSHEVKTPMTAIIGFADMLRSYACDAATIQSSAQFIYTEGKRLEELSYQLMELLSLSSTQIEKEKVALSALTIELEQYYAHEDTELIFQVEHCFVYANKALLFTLLRNLIDNGIKANKAQLPIHIKGSRIAQGYQLQVIDQGKGMSEEQLTQAMKPFYMADPSRKREQHGAGLGLSICKRICEAHQTTLTLTSSPTTGTSASFILEVIA